MCCVTEERQVACVQNGQDRHDRSHHVPCMRPYTPLPTSLLSSHCTVILPCSVRTVNCIDVVIVLQTNSQGDHIISIGVAGNETYRYIMTCHASTAINLWSLKVSALAISVPANILMSTQSHISTHVAGPPTHLPLHPCLAFNHQSPHRHTPPLTIQTGTPSPLIR